MASIFETIITDAQVLSSLLPTFVSHLSKNPTFVTLSVAIDEVAAAVLAKSFTFNVGGYSVTAKLNGSPVAFTISAAVLGVEKVVAGQVGSFACGDIEVDVQRIAPVATAAPVAHA